MAENTIKAGLDVSEIESGAKKAGVALRSIGDAVKEAGKQSAAGAAAVAAGYDKAGKEAERLAKKQERATQSIINSVQREIAVREAGGRGTAAYYETLARQRGADVARISEVTQALKRQESQLKLNNISVSQYNNAMRMVPAQFTDIFTQLAGGQNPFLIALQQGGQLRDSFGGFGNMFKGLAASINPATVAVAALAGGVAALGKAYYDGAEESQRFSAAVIFAGGSAGASADKLLSIADSVGRTTGGWSEARSAILAFVESGSVAAENYGRFAESVVLQSKATGKSVEDLARIYEEIADDPLKAVVKFSRVYQTLNADVYEQARALVEQGRQQEAVALVQSKFSDESQKMSERVLENLGAIERGWKAIKEAVSEAWEGMKEIGRDATLERRLFVAQEGLERAKAFAKNNPDGQRMVEQQQRVVDDLRAQIQAKDAKTARDAQQSKDREAGAKALEEFSLLSEQVMSREERFYKKRAERQNKLNALRKVGDAAAIAWAQKTFNKWERQEKAAIAAEKAREARKSSRPSGDKNLFPTTSAGLRLKPGAEDGGRAFGGTYAAMHAMQQFLGDKLVRFGAVNDKYHIGKNSFHNKGLAFDMTPNLSLKSEDKARVARQIRQYFESLGFKDGKDFNVKFEVGGQVNKNGTKATADHWHFNWRSQEAAARFAGGVDGQAKAMARSGLFAEARERKPELTGYQKWQEDFNRRAAEAEAKRVLEILNGNRAIGEQLKLLSDPTFGDWTLKQQADARELAEKADAQDSLTAASKKYSDIVKQMTDDSKDKLDDRLFEISLIGKTREEIEKLTLVRLWDRQIAKAREEGAPLESIDLLERGKAEGMSNLSKMQKARTDSDNNWRGGIESGLKSYIDSFGTMRQAMENATVQTFDKMGDALADFVATGKLDFRSLTVSILQDLSKMLIKMALFNAMKAAMGAWGGGGFRDGGMVQQFSNGGAVWGAGTSTSDSIPALLSNGEFVVNAAATRRHRALLEAVNQNRYASGGAVGKLPVMPAVPAFGVAAGGMTVNITINRDGTANADTSEDTHVAKRLAEAIPAMIERWYADNVHRVGGRYYAR